MEERDVREQEAMAALLADEFLCLFDGDIGRFADRVSAVGQLCRREMKGEKMPTRDGVDAVTVGDDDLSGVAQREIRGPITDGHRILARTNLNPLVPERARDVRHAHLYGNQSCRVSKKCHRLEARGIWAE